MEKLDKSIKIALILASVFVIISASGFFYEQIGSAGELKANFNQKKAVVTPVKNNKIVKMLFVGDIMLDRHVKEKINGQDVAYLFQGFKNDKFDFNKYDLVNANLEGAVTVGGSHYPPAHSYDFAFVPELIEKLKSYNFKSFNLANNHLTDQGDRGVIETEINLDKLNILHYGCPDAQVGDCSFKLYQAGGLKIGLVGFSQVYKKFDLRTIKNIVADLSGKTDLVIVNIHWGVEYNHVFNKIQQDLAHELVDSGADLIIGHHPHVVQGAEVYKNKPIFYSLGNFIFDQYFSRDTQEELAVEINLGPASGQAKAVLYPLISRQSQPSLMKGKQKEDYLERISGWSKGDKNFLAQIRQGEIVINF